MKVKISKDAVDDLDAIEEYLSQYGYEIAFNQYNKILEKIRELTIFPLKYPIFLETEHYIYRKLVVDKYIVFYIVDEKNSIIIIQRILHGSRDLKSYLK